MIKNYTEFIQENSSELQRSIADLNKKIVENTRKIENIVSTIAETGNVTLVAALENLETERDRLQSQLIREENKVKSRIVDESVIKMAFVRAKQMFESKELEDTKRLLNLYIENITVHKEHVDIIVNVLPYFSDKDDDINDMFRRLIPVNREIIYRYKPDIS